MTEYDYIVVGAGSAGCVLANRLSVDHDVLVLEAGEPDDKREISVPIAHPELLHTGVDWEFQTVPQSALADRRLYLAQGKTFGGSSSINAQMYFRGHRADFEAWATAVDGWGYDDVVPYFERLEDAEDPHLGTGGPQHLAGQADPNPVTDAFLDAAGACGIERTTSVAAALEGAGYTTVIQKDNRRYSAADAYLKPALDRQTLTATTGARVDRVLFDGDRATGVEYVTDGMRHQVTAAEEVVLSAGAINSPHLLLCSGVGPADHLTDHDIEVQADLPGVGRNLHDHTLVWTNYQSVTSDTYDDADGILNVLKYLLFKRGPLGSNGSEAVAFWRSTDDLEAPDIQFLFAPALVRQDGVADIPGHGYSIAVCLVHPESRGRLTLASADPTDDPVVDPQYLSHEGDIEAMVRGVEKAGEIAAAGALGEHYDGRVWPDGSDEATIRDHVRTNTQSYFHLVGTCKMGRDDLAVVDDRFRVHGIDGLRVVDASVMPTIPRANTYGPTMMLAERAAESILAAETPLP